MLAGKPREFCDISLEILIKIEIEDVLFGQKYRDDRYDHACDLELHIIFLAGSNMNTHADKIPHAN